MSLFFLTGATGFVGSNLARLLTDQGEELRCLVRPGNPATNLLGVPFERIEGSLEDEDILRQAMEGVDVVIHAAALVSFDRRDAALLHEVNTLGTARVARLAREQGVSRLVHISSVSAVGYSARPEVLDETTPYNFAPLRIPYCDTKRAAEEAVLTEVQKGLDAVIVNPASILGPGDRRKTEGSLLSAVAQRKIPFLPPGGVNMVDIRDVLSGILLALEHGNTGERYILGGENLSGPDLIRRIARIAQVAPPKHRLPRPLAQTYSLLASLW
ncbi:MAG TPA: NAD-dependent epimerase/dehydratase family protein, partial [Planctomycetes bacterium]|nr:NAD-dependent epimerase/dehydratase family protein [Planctomycetota bacterium]